MKTSSLLFATDHLEELIKRLMPVCLPLQLRELVVTAQDVTLGLISDQLAASCPLCGEPSRQVHSHYSRTLLRSALGFVARPLAPAGAPVFLSESSLLAQDLHRAAPGVG